MTDPAMADAAADFEVLRSRLFGIAYRIIGGVFDAEDVVQDVWVRWQGRIADGSAIGSRSS
jgi:DNA-directed RNA polymerase specialized sigma24 family protein